MINFWVFLKMHIAVLRIKIEIQNYYAAMLKASLNGLQFCKPLIVIL